MEIKAGTRLACPGSSVELVVVRPPSAPVSLACGGVDFVPLAGVTPDPSLAVTGDGPQIGKRYVDEDSGVEVLCSKAGPGALTCNGREMLLKDSKPLASSD
jgi:hypothetical protein